jgi:hypothetical protein
METLFPGAGFAIVFMAAVMESAKLIVAGWLASRWIDTLWLWRMLLIAFVLGLMSINAVGLFFTARTGSCRASRRTRCIDDSAGCGDRGPDRDSGGPGERSG